MSKKISVCIPSSCGGHLREIRMIFGSNINYDLTYILNDKINNKDFLTKNKVYYISHIENKFLLFINVFQCFFILRKLKPDFILSTGASPAFVVAILSKIFYRSKIIFIESITRINRPSKTGMIMYGISDLFIYRHINLRKYFPKGELFEL